MSDDTSDNSGSEARPAGDARPADDVRSADDACSGDDVRPGGDARLAAGMKVRRSVLGDAHVDRAEAAKSAFDEDFQRFITEGAWGSVWSRPGLTGRERSLVTITLLAALGHDDELTMHLRATANTGASAEDVKEALLHVAVYAGVPAANRAFKIAKSVFEKAEVDRSGDHAV